MMETHFGSNPRMTTTRLTRTVSSKSSFPYLLPLLSLRIHVHQRQGSPLGGSFISQDGLIFKLQCTKDRELLIHKDELKQGLLYRNV